MAMRDPAAVPMRIDALWSDGSCKLAPAMEDFTGLTATVPSGGGSFSDARPWLGESVDVPANEAIALPPGLHLHWTLPKALRRGTSVYAVTYAVLNELVQQGVPCSLVAALKAAVVLGREYDHDGFLQLLNGLVSGGGRPAPLGAGAFDVSSTATPYPGLISSDADIAVSTIVPDLKWDQIFLDVYGPTILHAATQMKLPPVPDRWLVIRTRKSDGATAAWVVESDRLTAPEPDGSAPAGAGPRGIPAWISRGKIVGWQDITAPETVDYLGLKTALYPTEAVAPWSENAGAARLSPFTAVGHGSLDFAAFYPNCQGVFGFHDGDADAATAYDYSVVGWFSAPASDPLSTSYAVTPWAVGTTPESRAKALGWTVDDADWSKLDGSVYVAGITVTGSACTAQADEQLPADAIEVAVGNTAGEALSAFVAKGQGGTAVGLAPETVLNAAQSGVLGSILGPDGPGIIENALHRQGFQSEPGGWIWQVAARPPSSAGLSGSPQDGRIAFSTALSTALNRLNVAQLAFDRALGEQRAQRHLLFTDWCRALHLETDASGASADPPFPNGSNLTPGGAQLSNVAADALTQSAESVRRASVGSTGASSNAAMAPYVAATALYLAYADTLKALAAMPDAANLYLRRQPGPRYWRPNDPIVLMTEAGGGNLTASPAEALPAKAIAGVDYLALTVVSPGQDAPAYLPAGWDAIPGVPAATVVAGAVPAIDAVAAAVSWRPLSLQWAAKYFSYPHAGSISAAKSGSSPFTVQATIQDYGADFVSGSFQPDGTGIDLVPKPGVQAGTNDYGIYRGRAILSSHAQETMRTRILQLTGQLKTPPATSAGLELPGVLGDDPVKSLLGKAYDSKASTLAQALNGFNDQLLMLRRISQVSKFSPNYKSAAWQSGTADPVPAWDEVSQSFYNEIGTQGRSSPDQDAVYSPIRAGNCQLTELVLVDAFGQRRRWQAAAQSANTVISNTLVDETGPDAGAAPAFLLPPRFAQASRVMFRWLASDGSDEVETNQDPATTPVCGWLALNRVDETVMVFLRDGTLVGWIATGDGTMTYLPGKSEADITDPYLQQVVAQVATAGGADAFYDDVNQALLTIEPGSHRHHVSRSVLESRPLALARAQLGLQLQGVPLPHQGYAVLAAQTMSGGGLATEPAPSPYIQRETCGFENVAIPVRLGDVSMDDDGLVAFWPVSAGTIAEQYELVSTDPEAGPDQEPSVVVTAAPAAMPKQVLFLLDPRAKIHAATGLLPVKDIAIPNEMFADALRRMDYLMQVGPVLTPAARVAMPLPAETRQAWNWLVADGGQWSSAVTPSKTDDRAHPASEPAVIRAGYLKIQ